MTRHRTPQMEGMQPGTYPKTKEEEIAALLPRHEPWESIQCSLRCGNTWIQLFKFHLCQLGEIPLAKKTGCPRYPQMKP
jgi:hypothetical protein